MLIDLDGTLIDTAPEIACAVNSMLATMNLPTLATVQITTYIGDGATTLIKRCLTGRLDGEPEPALLAKHDLLPFFELVVSGDTLQKKKPEPDQIFYVCEQLGVSAQEVALIGDSKTDISAARSAGCKMFAVPYGYNQGQRIEATEVDALIDNIGDILDLLH